LCERGTSAAVFPKQKMKLSTTRLDTRVAIFRLIVMLAVIALPSMPWTDRSASAAVPIREVATPAVGTSGSATVEVDRSVFDAAAWDPAAIGSVDREVFELALHAAAVAVERGDATDPATLTVIDFSKTSPTERMWVYDLRSRELVFQEVVSHGRGSGVAVAKSFSNTHSSHQSSIGLYRTAETYVGKHGYSLRLDGLDKGYNDNARARAIVMHAADYVNPAAAKTNGYLGRSLGCPAIRPAISRQLIDTVKEGSLLFAYYPDEAWLSNSPYLN
jgi:hypothetical protein